MNTPFAEMFSSTARIFFRSVYKRFCGGTLKSFISHPFLENERLFFIIDPTHNIKNIYNNWQRKGTLHVPSGYDSILPEMKAEFKHIVQLYQREELSVLKVANRLRKDALNPSNLHRTSPVLALCKSKQLDHSRKIDIHMACCKCYVESIPI